MESSKGYRSRKRKRSPAGNCQDNASSEDKLKSVCPNIPGSSHATTIPDNNSEDINYHTDSATDKCSDTANVIPSSSCSTSTGSSHQIANIISNSEESSSTHSVSHLDECSTMNISSNSDDHSSSHSDSHLNECSTLESLNVSASSSHSKNTGSQNMTMNISSNSEESSSSCGGIHPEKCSAVDLPNVTASTSFSKNTVSGSSYKPNYYSELPETVMHNIYRCLPFKDLVNIRDVCDSWKYNTDKSSVWKHVPLSLNDSNIERLPLAPYIHTVKGNILNTELCVNVLVNYFQDLRKLLIHWKNNISAVQISKLISKFPNLECILLNISAPEIIETLAVLQNAPRLKEIKFAFPVRNISWTPFFNMLGKLKSLDTFDLSHIFSFVNSSELFYLLELKMKSLVSLKVNIDNLTTKDIQDNISIIMSKIICDSDRLMKLDFVACVKDLSADINLNFAQMKNLKSLRLWLFMNMQPSILAQITFPVSLEFLELFFANIPGTQNILQRVINSCPNLKYLNATNVEDENINEQLEHIDRLQNLHTLILQDCRKLSGQGLQHIGGCSELRVLKLTRASLDNTACNCLKSCKYLQEIELYKCDIRPRMLTQTILVLERLTHLRLVSCYQKNGNNKHRFSTKYLKHIFRKCNDKNPVLKINFHSVFSVFRFNSFFFPV